MTFRDRVKKIMPQACYMNLAGNHCIDDDYNDRYLAYGCSSRKQAWKAALKFLLKREKGEERTNA